MKLVRFGEIGKEKPGLLEEGGIIDVSAQTRDFDEDFFASGGLVSLANWRGNLSSPPEILKGSPRLASCVARPSKIICIGLNYQDHAKEAGATLPKEPIIFFKSTSALSGPGDEVLIPRGSKKADWEVELAVVIGKKASYVEEHKSLDYVAGYCLTNDYSEREFQLERDGQWVKGKSSDSFAPLGPFMATTDEITDIDNLSIWLKVNGEMRQDGTTADLIFKVPKLISYISHFMTLLPGDVISTGTPAGVGLGMKPPTFLKHADIVGPNGESVNPVVHPRPALARLLEEVQTALVVEPEPRETR